MSNLTQEERTKIYEEEKAKLEAKAQLDQRPKNRKSTKIGWKTQAIILAVPLIICIAIYAYLKISSPALSKREQTTQTKYTAPAKPLFIAYENANIRSSPSTSGQIIGKLEKYETIRIDGYEKDWLKCTKGGKTGYVLASLLKLVDNELHVKVNKYAVDEYGHYEVVGEVINLTQDAFKFVVVKAVFYDKKKNIVGTDTTYACATDYILPGRVKPFKFMGENQPDYNSVAVSMDHFTKVE